MPLGTGGGGGLLNEQNLLSTTKGDSMSTCYSLLVISPIRDYDDFLKNQEFLKF